MFDFHTIFCYVGTNVCYIYWQYQPFWIISLFLIDKNVNRVLVCSSEQKFNRGITSLRKAEKMALMMLDAQCKL